MTQCHFDTGVTYDCAAVMSASEISAPLQVVQFLGVCIIGFLIGAKLYCVRKDQCLSSVRPACQDHSMDMERRLRGAWKKMSETHEPFSESVATANLETRVVSSRHIRSSHSGTDDRQQSMLDGYLASVHNTNTGNSEIEKFASLVSLGAQQRTQRKRKKQRKKNKPGKNPHILVMSRLEIRKARVSLLQHTGCSPVP